MTASWKKILRTARCNDGSSILETALLMPIIFLLISGAIDFGRAYYTAIEVSSAAHAGALYGVQNPTDASGMEAAAKLDAPDLSGLQTSAAYGCECADGGISTAVVSCTTTPNCTYNYVNYVSVTATQSYTPIVKYPGIPSSLTLSSTARLRAGGD